MLRDHKSELEPHLNPDETLLWTGQPKTGIIFRVSDIFLIPFSIIWCGLVIFFATKEESIIWRIYLIPFVIVGLLAVFGRFGIEAIQRKNISYGITKERILIRSGILRKKLRSIPISTLSDIEYDEKLNGSGSIYIGPRNPRWGWEDGMNWWLGQSSNPQLAFIPNVRKVFEKILELQKKEQNRGEGL